MSAMIAWPPIRKISVYRWPQMLSKRMSLASASSCGSLAESSFMARPLPFFSAGPDTFSSPVLAGLQSRRRLWIAVESVDPFNGRAFPFRSDHLGPGEVHTQDHEPFTVRRAWQPVRCFFLPGRFGLQVDRQPAVRILAE